MRLDFQCPYDVRRYSVYAEEIMQLLERFLQGQGFPARGFSLHFETGAGGVDPWVTVIAPNAVSAQGFFFVFQSYRHTNALQTFAAEITLHSPVFGGMLRTPEIGIALRTTWQDIIFQGFTPAALQRLASYAQADPEHVIDYSIEDAPAGASGS